MRIAVIGSKGLPPRQGGIEHHCAEVYPRMVQRGHTVDLYARSSYTKEPAGTIRNFNGVNTFTLPSLKVRGLDAFANAAMAAVLSSRRRYDVVHFHALGPSLFTPIPKWVSEAKVVATCHGLDWKREKWGAISTGVIKAGEWTAMKSAHAFTVVSESLQSYFIKNYGFPTHYVGNAPVTFIKSDLSCPYVSALGLSTRRYLVFVGRLVPEKCPDLLIQAFNTLQIPGWKLVFVGGTSDTSVYSTRLFEQARANPNIIFTGELEGGRLSEVVCNAGLFVLPSNVEGLPLALLEAMNEKIPVVVSDIPVHQQIVGKDRGLLFKQGDAVNCAKQLHWAIQRPAIMDEFAERAASYVKKHHNWDDITYSYLRLYEHILEAPLNGELEVDKQTVEIRS